MEAFNNPSSFYIIILFSFMVLLLSISILFIVYGCKKGWLDNSVFKWRFIGMNFEFNKKPPSELVKDEGKE